MTNKEAIEILDAFRFTEDDLRNAFYEEDKAIEMAIKALEVYDKILPLLDPDIDAELALEKIREVIYE